MIRASLAVALAALAGCGGTPDPAPGPWPLDATCTQPLPYPPFSALLARTLCQAPLLVTGDDQTDSNALLEAGRQLSAALRRADLVDALRKEGALIAVYSRSLQVCDLSYFADLSGTAPCEARGGLGGVPGRPVTACSERNLLSLGSDEFRRGTVDGESVCIHEIGHLVMNVAVDQATRERIGEAYRGALAAGRWKDTYAATNADEYFAELTQSYFSANPRRPVRLHNGINGPQALRDYDLAGFALMEELYLVPADLR